MACPPELQLGSRLAQLHTKNLAPDTFVPLEYLLDSTWLALYDCIHISLGNLVVHFSQDLRRSRTRGRQGHQQPRQEDIAQLPTTITVRNNKHSSMCFMSAAWTCTAHAEANGLE